MPQLNVFIIPLSSNVVHNVFVVRAPIFFQVTREVDMPIIGTCSGLIDILEYKVRGGGKGEREKKG